MDFNKNIFKGVLPKLIPLFIFFIKWQKRNFSAPTLVEQKYQEQGKDGQNFPAIDYFQQPRFRKTLIESYISNDPFSPRRINLSSNSPGANYNRSQRLAEEPYKREMTADRIFKDLFSHIHDHI